MKSVRTLPLEMRTEAATVLLSKPMLALFLLESRELAMGNRAGDRRVLRSGRMLPLEMRSETVIVFLSAVLLSPGLQCMRIERVSY